MNLPTFQQLNADQKSAFQHLSQFISQPPTPGEFQSIRMSGPPGSGKTTTLVLAMQGVADQSKNETAPKILITAPTNKATRQLRKMLDGVGVTFETSTIYKALGMRLMDSGEVRHVSRASDNPEASKYKIVVVDEYSMLNTRVTEELENVALRFGLKIIFLGDDDQIPPVKESKSPVSQMVPDFIELSKIERSDAGSPVQATVKMIREKIRSEDYSEVWLENQNSDSLGGQYVLSGADWLNHFKEQARVCWNSGNIDHSRAIAYTNAKVDFLNEQARQHIHGPKVSRFLPKETLIIASPVIDSDEKLTIFPTDEEVEVIDVDPDGQLHDMVAETGSWRVWNLSVRERGSDYTYLLSVLHESEKSAYEKACNDIKKRCYADRSQWSKLFYPFQEQFHQVKYPYAITAHRSQGSTYHTVFVDAKNMSNYLGGTLSADMYWRLLYVAISRAKFNVAVNHPAL